MTEEIKNVETEAAETAAKKKTPQTRTRLFAAVTYLTAEQINDVIDTHRESIKRWCWIEHNLDVNDDGTPKEAHKHIVIETYNPFKAAQIKKWFLGYKDDDGKAVNTLVEAAKSRTGITDYLTHKDNNDKHPYSTDDIVNLPDYLFIARRNAEQSRDDEEPALQIFNDLLCGTPEYTMVRRYGREYIINRQKYIDCVQHCFNDGSIPREYYSNHEPCRLDENIVHGALTRLAQLKYMNVERIEDKTELLDSIRRLQAILESFGYNCNVR